MYLLLSLWNILKISEFFMYYELNEFVLKNILRVRNMKNNFNFNK